MATPSRPSAKDKLLDAAERLMLTKGFVATTVDEICHEAGLTKGSFFHYFKSKEALGKELLDRFCQVRLELLQASPSQQKADPLERVYGWVDFAIEMAKNPMAQKGCLLGNFAQELSDTHPQMRFSCAHHFSDWAGLLKKEIDEVAAKHSPKAPVDSASLAEHLIAVIEGALIIAKAKQDMQVMEQSLLHFKRYLKSLFET